ncbi:hypothetical protein GDO86_002747 [Hymenochirus boettgeri]|uniref:Uncharacterized protein n=1 Tax=Hymenochirus boettgeri TaxID=247094 RepID=A0A8T2JYF5_9PIPI|nr:hypothetical protein GDO86_002747 [Hymenochirus boettgeri]
MSLYSLPSLVSQSMHPGCFYAPQDCRHFHQQGTNSLKKEQLQNPLDKPSMEDAINLTSSLETILKKLVVELYQNMSRKEASQKGHSQADSIGSTAYILVLIAVFSFFIISLLVIALKSRSYDQLPDQSGNANAEVKNSLGIKEKVTCLIHKKNEENVRKENVSIPHKNI